MDKSIFDGGCLCGAIRYRSEEEPTRCVICHCEDCRKHSGAPCLSFVHFPKSAFKWLTAEPHRYRSSRFAERGFCPKCGSTVSMHEEVLEDRVQIAIGSLDNPHDISPQDHVWTSSKINWFEVNDNLPRFEKSSTAVPSKASTE
ncbi:MAG: GFA family protein [Gammaproteobacteria bacterium]|nr:GFA family protein [Gammaproteobacteria bacterium]